MVALSSILAALFARERTKEGQYLDISIMDGAFIFHSLFAGQALRAKKLKEGKTMLSGGLPNYNVYRCKDDRFVVLPLWKKDSCGDFCALLTAKVFWSMYRTGKPQKNKKEKLKEFLTNIFLGKTRKEWNAFSHIRNVVYRL